VRLKVGRLGGWKEKYISHAVVKDVSRVSFCAVDFTI
jgi:hypothetical protein